MSQLSWVVAGIVPGIEREPLKKLAPDEGASTGAPRQTGSIPSYMAESKSAPRHRRFRPLRRRFQV